MVRPKSGSGIEIYGGGVGDIYLQRDLGRSGEFYHFSKKATIPIIFRIFYPINPLILILFLLAGGLSKNEAFE
jgi:hypothetical protein